MVQVSTLRSFLRTLGRRKLIFLAATILVPAAAVGVSLTQNELHEASADVFLSRQNLANSLTGTPDPLAYQQADRVAQTQAYLASEPKLAERVVRAAGVGSAMTAHELLDHSTVTPMPNGDLLVFRVVDQSPSLAKRLATAYAQQFSRYRREIDTAAMSHARREVESELGSLRARGEARGKLYESLVDKRQQLRTMEALETSNAFVVREADRSAQIQPRPVRNAVLALALGLMLGIGLAFLRESLDSRVRSVDDMGQHLGLPLLGRLPAPKRRFRGPRLVMLHDPHGPQAEAVRMLRTNLKFATLERDVRTIMITSAVEQEGKSTTAANLALALAATGKRVVLVDLDLRRPALSRLLQLESGPGLTDVALGHASLDEAIVHVHTTKPAKAKRLKRKERKAAADGNGQANGDGNGNGHAKVQSFLEVLPSGPPPPDIGEFAGTRALEEIIWALRDRADIVIVDAPPVLHVGDALALTFRMDAVLVVARLHRVRRAMLSELARLLESAPVAKLGFVASGVGPEVDYGYDDSFYYRAHQHERAHEHAG